MLGEDERDDDPAIRVVEFPPGGPVGLQLEEVVTDHHQIHHGESSVRVVRFVDGGPQNPGMARKSGQIQPGDWILTVQVSDKDGSSDSHSTRKYSDMLRILQQTHLCRKVTVRSFAMSVLQEAAHLSAWVASENTASNKSVSKVDPIPRTEDSDCSIIELSSGGPISESGSWKTSSRLPLHLQLEKCFERPQSSLDEQVFVQLPRKIGKTTRRSRPWFCLEESVWRCNTNSRSAFVLMETDPQLRICLFVQDTTIEPATLAVTAGVTRDMEMAPEAFAYHARPDKHTEQTCQRNTSSSHNTDAVWMSLGDFHGKIGLPRQLLFKFQSRRVPFVTFDGKNASCRGDIVISVDPMNVTLLQNKSISVLDNMIQHCESSSAEQEESTTKQEESTHCNYEKRLGEDTPTPTPTSNDLLVKAKAKHQLSLARLRVKRQFEKRDTEGFTPREERISGENKKVIDSTSHEEIAINGTVIGSTLNEEDGVDKTVMHSTSKEQSRIDTTDSKEQNGIDKKDIPTYSTSKEEIGLEFGLSRNTTEAVTGETIPRKHARLKAKAFHQPPEVHEQLTASSPGCIDFAQYSMEQTIIFEPGPVGMQLDPVLDPNRSQPSISNPGIHQEYAAARIARFVDGGPQDPGQARSSGRLRPGDYVVRVEAEGIVGTTYYTVLHLLQKSWTTRKLTFRSAWDPSTLQLESDNSHPGASKASNILASDTLIAVTPPRVGVSRPVSKSSPRHRSPRPQDVGKSPLPYDWTPLPYDWIRKRSLPSPDVRSKLYLQEVERLMETAEYEKRAKATGGEERWDFGDAMIGAIAVTAESVSGCFRKRGEANDNDEYYEEDVATTKKKA